MNIVPKKVVDYTKRRMKKVGLPCLAEVKYDGVRCIAVKKDGGDVKLYSKTGKEFTNFHRVTEYLSEKLSMFRDFTLDGEVYGDTLSAIMTVAHRKHGEPEVPVDYKYAVWQCNTPNGGGDSIDYALSMLSRRYEVSLHGLELVLCYSTVHMATQRLCHNDSEVTSFYNEIVDGGGEGIVIKPLGYDGVTGLPIDVKDVLWLRMKAFVSSEFTVTGIVPHSKREGLLGALECVTAPTDGNPVKFHVGTGFSEAQRKAMFTPETIGRLAEVKYRFIGTQGRPVLPVFLRFREDYER